MAAVRATSRLASSRNPCRVWARPSSSAARPGCPWRRRAPRAPRPPRPGMDGWAGRPPHCRRPGRWPSRATGRPGQIALLLGQAAQLAVGAHRERAHARPAQLRLGDLQGPLDQLPGLVQLAGLAGQFGQGQIPAGAVVVLADPLGDPYAALQVRARSLEVTTPGPGLPHGDQHHVGEVAVQPAGREPAGLAQDPQRLLRMIPGHLHLAQPGQAQDHPPAVPDGLKFRRDPG